MIYVTLTTIPERLKNLNKSVDSLLKQSKKPDKIFINIPHKYKRFDEIINDRDIPKFEDSRIEITRSEDYGPGTKLLGSIKKFEKNSLVILVDDDNVYAEHMIESFFHYYSIAPENAYSFYVHPLKNFGVGQGADGFAINNNFLTNVKKFYDLAISRNDELFIHDDLWISFYLYYIKKVKILSLQSQLKKTEDGRKELIYKKHNHDGGLISTYGKNINDAIKTRDKISLKNLDYMFKITKDITF